MDFPVTREIFERFENWLNPMADLLPRPIKEPLAAGGFIWVFPEQSAEVVQIAKAVRMITAFRGALLLADRGLTSECYTLLRSASDFAAEIVFLAEGILAGKFNKSQQKFIDQFFAPFPTNPKELAAQARERYVERTKIVAAHVRLFRLNANQMQSVIEFLNKTHDAYVHGAYGTAMELFSGQTYQFMLAGHDSERSWYAAKLSVCGKLFGALVALEFMAISRRMSELVGELKGAREHLFKEQSSALKELESSR